MKFATRRSFLSSITCLGAAATTVTWPGFVKPTSAQSAVTSDRNQQKFIKAVQAGEVETVARMLHEDSNLINVKDSAGRSVYAIALLEGHRNIAKKLVQAGYKSDLHEAALALEWKRLEELVNAVENAPEKLNESHPIGGTAMYAAAAGGAGTNIWRVYGHGGEPSIEVAGAGMTPLQKGLRFPDLETAEMTAFTLLANSTDPNQVGSEDSPPIHIAAERGSFDIVEMLIRLGADVDAKDSKGRSCLQVARIGKWPLITELIENHQEISRSQLTFKAQQDCNGERYVEPDWTGISRLDRSGFVGVSHGNMEQVKARLAKNKRLAHSVATTGERAVEAGAHMGNKPIVSLLLDQGAPYSLATAVMMGDRASVVRSLDKNPDRIHERGAHDFALLWYPVIGQCNLEMTELLLERGAKVEEQSQLGTTALHWASMRGEIDLVKLLIESGANVNRVGRKFGGQRRTPLQLTKNKKIMDLLKANGATSD